MLQSWQTSVRGIAVLALYLYTFWSIFKTHRGNNVVRCGVIALVVAAALIVLMRFPSVPGWLLGATGVLLLSLCLLTIGFLFQQALRAIGRRLHKSE
jgi:hypothetical protein